MSSRIHATADAIELYSLGRLGEAETAALEEHLLLCPECQARVEAEDSFIAAARGALERPAGLAAPSIPATETRSRRWPLFTFGALAAVTAATAFVLLLPQRQIEEVQLAARRGVEEVRSRAHSGAPLRLRIDANELPPANAFRVEIVTPSGAATWTGNATTQGGVLVVNAPALAPGLYWVRLHAAGSDDLLREFSLAIE